MADWLDDRQALADAQAESRAAGDVWREGDPMRVVRAAFDAVDHGDAGAVAAVARTLLADGDWIGAALTPLVAGLAADVAFQPPFRVQSDALRTGAVLLEHPAAIVSLTVISADALAAMPPAACAVASGRLSIVRYHRAGGAHLRRWQAPPAAAEYVAADEVPLTPLPDLPLADGAVVTLDGRTGATLLEGATRDVAMVTVSVRAGMASVMRDYALPSGRLIRAASIDERDSRTAMLLTLLRTMGRADAGETFLAATWATAFHLRWQAMREWLATDAAAAMPRLAEMASEDPHPEVRGAALLTLAQLDRREAA